ncbi:biopolymer transporter ExbB [Thalassovita sp.]|uniref:biopolymer transporter ExbB n=1 Tax=Thalassovita sp. TaxID=1979401 RepID=UPI002AB0C553|nr:biopolymer transporter ExbB [Thalassovita sp.]
MVQTDHEVEPQFSPPVRQIISMVLVLGLSAGVVFLALPRILPVFEANPYLNGFILFVFGVGVLSCFWQVAQLFNSVRWIEGFVSEREQLEHRRAPRLLAPLAALLGKHSARMEINASSTSSILDSVATRIDEAREITRYIVNLLIFLGLLGTFYGLATTVPALVDTIRGLAPVEGESGVEVFGRLMSGLDQQLSGMGVAFGSSLLGLAGSLVVGLLELFAGHGQNRFYRELEEWLSTITRVTFSSGEGETSGEYGAAVQILDHMLEQMDRMRQMFEQSEMGRSQVDAQLGALAHSIERLTDRMADDRSVNSALERVADGQEKMIETLSQTAGEGMDAESRMRLRSIDVQLLRILEEISAGRQETMAELRMDIASLTRLVAQGRIAEHDQPNLRSPRIKGKEG